MEADDLRAHGSGAQDAGAQDAGAQDWGARARADHAIADRLDALEAERVLQRALELEADALDEPHVITTSQLERIAKEIGVDPAFVHQALGELRLEAPTQGRVARWILGSELVESATLTDLSRADVDAAITKWMTQHEGMVAGGPLPSGIEWHVDRRWRSRVIARSISGGNRISRVAGGDVSHRVHSLSDDEHIVAVHSEGRWPRTFATLVLAVGTALNTLMLLGAAVTNDLLVGLGAFAAIAAATVGVAIGGARWWANGIRSALRRSLHGLASTAKPKRTSWLSRRRKKN